VLAATFVAFPLLGLAARGLVPSVLTPDLYTGVLFLCLVPSTVQSSIAFTSIAHGNVPAAIVSASLSNILGVVLTPLLVVLLMHTTGAPRIDGSAVLDIVVQLLLPFIAGQLSPASGRCPQRRGSPHGCTGMRWSLRHSTAARSCSSSTPLSR
jgi:solute carrier family 10 (sodium/bile acid cotransporter), member 7